MDVVSDLPSDAQPEKPVQQREALFDDPTQLAQPGAVLGATAGDDRRDAEFADKTAVAVVVVAAVGVDLRRLAARSPAFAADRRYRWQQWQQLGHVIAVAAGQQHRQRDSAGVIDQVVFGARPAAVYRTPTRFGPPLSARMWLESTTARDRSSFPAARSSAAGLRASVATPRRCSSREAAASTSCRSRSRARPAAIPTGYPCREQTRCRTALCGHRPAGDQDLNEAAASGSAARPGPEVVIDQPRLRVALPHAIDNDHAQARVTPVHPIELGVPKPVSRQLGLALRDWLPEVIQSIEPWMSSEDIDKGQRWAAEVGAKLGELGEGVLCTTGENMSEPWLNFEAGALAKSLDDSRVRPLLLEVQPSDITDPLAQFQATVANDHDDMLKFISSLNESSATPLDPVRLQRAFARN